MAAISGVTQPNQEQVVQQMLDRMAHRGKQGMAIREIDGITVGCQCPPGQLDCEDTGPGKYSVKDYVSDGHFAVASIEKGGITFKRDPFGVSPLYYGSSSEGVLYFASEVKGLPSQIDDIHELPPGSTYRNGLIEKTGPITTQPTIQDQRLNIAAELRRLLVKSVEKRANRGISYGVWLSGGLDSSALAALVRPRTERLHTFTVGFEGSPDLEYARAVARHIESTHHEIIPDFNELVSLIPDVIYQLESFDAPVVRSSLMNYLAAREASNYVESVFSGDGGDELFGGYGYLKVLSLDELTNELIDLTSRLHNTALQRVDRCSAAFGLTAYLAFLDPDLLAYASRIPSEYKIFNGMGKWILRRSVLDLLPQRVVMREEERFYLGSGLGNRVAAFVEGKISDREFSEHIEKQNSPRISSKEELYYYRIFQEHFGHLKNLDWVGRTQLNSTD